MDNNNIQRLLIRIRSTSDPKGLSYDSNMIKKPPSGFGGMPIKWVSTAMFSLVRIRPMFEQEAPKWSWLDSDMTISRTKGKAGFRYDPLPVGCFHHLIKKTYRPLRVKKDRGPALLLYIIYTSSKYIHLESRWLKYSKAGDERYSTAGGSPPPTYVSLCALEHRWGSMTRCSDSCWPQRVLPKEGIACAYQTDLGWARTLSRLPERFCF